MIEAPFNRFSRAFHANCKNCHWNNENKTEIVKPPFFFKSRYLKRERIDIPGNRKAQVSHLQKQSQHLNSDVLSQ
jgi:hypothetical protein